jgi:aminoglycoside phosphotransferase (APT) family kinase protein
MNKADITPCLVTRLLADQLPDLADLPVTPVDIDGWDNTTFRLGEELVVRLPTADAYVPQVEKEHRWLPRLASHLPLPIPEPVAMCAPARDFPRPWSIYRWLQGTPATADSIRDLDRLATDLADFLSALYAIDPTGGPAAGEHSFFRGSAPTIYDLDTRNAIAAVAGEIDTDAATDVWEAALAASWRGTPVWVHGDITAANLLVLDGRLSAVIDFGCLAVGDPACDLAIAWTLFDRNTRAAFRERLAVDDSTWARGRGWALWKALLTLVESLQRDGATSHLAERRFGWRLSARGVIDEIITDAREDG